MKKQSINLFETISPEHRAQLTSVVNETIATDYAVAPNKIFTAAELWNIQRQGKTSITRRRFA
jgi:hypothetical protein